MACLRGRRNLSESSLDLWVQSRSMQNNSMQWLFIQKTTEGYLNYAFKFRPDDGERYIGNDSAVGTKVKARFPFVEPIPFIK